MIRYGRQSKGCKLTFKVTDVMTLQEEKLQGMTAKIKQAMKESKGTEHGYD